jgi:hypothetical protein
MKLTISLHYAEPTPFDMHEVDYPGYSRAVVELDELEGNSSVTFPPVPQSTEIASVFVRADNGFGCPCTIRCTRVEPGCSPQDTISAPWLTIRAANAGDPR